MSEQIILAIESSCDETAAAVIKNVIYRQWDMPHELISLRR